MLFYCPFQRKHHVADALIAMGVEVTEFEFTSRPDDVGRSMSDIAVALAIVPAPVVEARGAFSAHGLIRDRVEESVAAKQQLLADRTRRDAGDARDRCVEILRGGGKVLIFGNGGSAADATHLAAEFVGRFAFDRAPLPAMSLSDNASSMTAIGNDYSYDLTFARQIGAFGSAGDVAIGSPRAARLPTC